MDSFSCNHLNSPADTAATPEAATPEAAAPQYYGLMNQGATCYLNSVLQVLFMTKEFREAVNSFTDKHHETTINKVLDPDLKDLFEDLMHSKTYTYKITRALKIDRVYEQRDAAEYLEKILGLTSQNAAKIFHGQMAHRTTCSKCKNVMDTDGLFWHLPFELVDSYGGNYSVEEGIEKYFKPSYFHGDNQMYCDTCDDKVDASSKYVVKHHPDVLILLLKRFDFSYQLQHQDFGYQLQHQDFGYYYMSYVKIECDIDVPYTLKIPENQTYELYAVVDHSGNLKGGHYSATIKTRDGEDRWFRFDDTTVAALNSSPFTDKRNIARFPNAYLLFYRKKADIQAKGSKRITSSGNENAENDRKPKKSKQERDNSSFCAWCETGSADDTDDQEQFEPTKTKAEKPDVDPDVHPGDSKIPAVLPGHERQGHMNVCNKRAKKREYQEEFMNGETEGMEKKQKAENAEVYGQNMTSNKNHQENPEPSRLTVVDQTTPDVSQDFNPEDREKVVSAALEGQDDICESRPRLSDGATDEKQEEQEVKYETEDYDRYKQRITSTDRNTEDQEENRNLSPTGDQTEVKDRDKVDLSENIQTTPDVRLNPKLGGSERTPLPAVHGEINPAATRLISVATDEKEQLDTNQNSENRGQGMKSKDENMKPVQYVKPGDKETSAGHDREDDVRDPSARFIDEETKGTRSEHEKSDSSRKDTAVNDIHADDQEGNVFNEGQQEVQAGPVFSQRPVVCERQEKTNGPQEELTNVETEVMKIKHEAKNADYYSINSTSNKNNQENDKHQFPSEDQHKVDNAESVGLTGPTEKKPDVNPEPADSETSAVPAACDRQGGMSDTKVVKTSEKTENEKIKHEIENSDTHSDTSKSFGDEDENRDRSTIGATKVMDPKKSNLTETKKMGPDVNYKPEYSETSAACGSQADMSDPHKLMGHRTTDKINQTETSDVHENLEKDRSLLCTGELNKNKDPVKSEPTGTKETNPDVHPDVNHVDHKTTAVPVVVYLKYANNKEKRLIHEKNEPTIKPEAVSSGRSEQKQRVKDDDDEVNNHLLSIEIQVEKVVDGSGAEGPLCTRQLKCKILMGIVAVLVALCVLIFVLTVLL